MAKKISTHDQTVLDQFRSILSNASAYAGNTGNEPLAQAVRGLQTLERPTADQIGSVIKMPGPAIPAGPPIPE